MTGPAQGPAHHLSLVFVYGRLQGLTRAQVEVRLSPRGGQLTRNPLRATTIVLSWSSARSCLDPQGRLKLPFPAPRDRVISEAAFMHAIGAVGSQARNVVGPYGIDDVARLSGLSADTCAGLAAFDVLSPVEGFHAYQDIAAAKQVAHLMGQGVPVQSVVRAAHELGRRGLRMSQVRLAEAPWGEVVQQLGSTTVGLDGQFVLVLGEEAESADQWFEEAERCEAEGHLEHAERSYARAEQTDRADPVIPFNRGNVLAAMARVPEAMVAFRQALQRDPEFAEAAFNLASLYQAAGQTEEALSFYRHAVQAHPTYSQAIFNLARLLTQQLRFKDALPLWDRFIDTAPDDPDVHHARRLSLFCRMQSST